MKFVLKSQYSLRNRRDTTTAYTGNIAPFQAILTPQILVFLGFLPIAGQYYLFFLDFHS